MAEAPAVLYRTGLRRAGSRANGIKLIVRGIAARFAREALAGDKNHAARAGVDAFKLHFEVSAFETAHTAAWQVVIQSWIEPGIRRVTSRSSPITSSPITSSLITSASISAAIAASAFTVIIVIASSAAASTTVTIVLARGGSGVLTCGVFAFANGDLAEVRGFARCPAMRQEK